MDLAFNFRGKSLGLIHSAISSEIAIAISEPIIAKTIRVLLSQDFDWQPYKSGRGGGWTR
jgi:hypothetical protein